MSGWTPDELVELLTPYFCPRGPNGCFTLYDYDREVQTGAITTVAVAYVDMTNMTVSLTVPGPAFVVVGMSVIVRNTAGLGRVYAALTDSANNLLAAQVGMSPSDANRYMTLAQTHYDTVEKGTHSYKIRWYVTGGTGEASDRQMWAAAFNNPLA